MEKKKTSTCLIGCGVGCVLLVVVAIVMIASGAWFVRDTMSGFDDAVETRASLEERFGEARDFTPAPDGSIAADRMEAFLAIRDETREPRAAVAGAFAALPLSDAEAEELDAQPFFEKMGSVFGITTSALGLGAKIGEFFAARNAAFDRHGMGLGEYSYIYVLAYYNLLGVDPEDGPGGDEADRHGDFGDTYRRVRRNLIANLENQLATLEAPTAEAEPGGLRAALEAEIEALEQNRYRIPWQDSLPPAIEASLDPYRDRLLATYVPEANPFELARMERHGRFTIEAD